MKTTAYWVALGALFLIPLLALFVPKELYFPFITGKGFAFRILVEIAAAAWLLLALMDKAYRPRFSWLFIIYSALVVWMAVADLLAVNPHKAFWSNYERMEGWVTLIHVFIFFVVSGALFAQGTLWRKWWLTFVGVSALVCAYGLMQIACAGSACGAPGQALSIHQGGRIDASLGNAAYLPAYLLFALAVAFWQGAMSKQKWLRYSLFVLGVVQIIVLLFTATRGAFFALIGGLLVACVLALFYAGGRVRTVTGTALAVLILLVGGFYAARNTSVVEHSLTLSRLASSFEQGALDVRTQIWGIAFEGVAERPVFGWGHEGFNYVFNAHYKPTLYGQEQWFDRAHNVFIDWAIAGGIPALFLFLALFLASLVALYRGPFTVVERIAILGAFVAYGIQGLAVFDNLFTYIPLAALFAFIHGRTARPIAIFENQAATSSKDTIAASAVVVAVTGVVIWIVNVPGIVGAEKLIDSFAAQNNPEASMQYLSAALSAGTFATQEVRENMVYRASASMGQPSISAGVQAKLGKLALVEIEKEIEESPQDARLRLEYATAYQVVGDLDGTLREIDAALALSPQKQMLMIERGKVFWQQKKLTEARAIFYDAWNLEKTNVAAAVYAAVGDILVGDNETAHNVLMEAYGTEVIDDPALLTVYQQTKQIDKIIPILEARVKATNGAPDARYKLAIAYAQGGRIPDARKEIEETMAANPSAVEQGQQLLSQLNAVK